jgi:hypothetical protein
MVEGDGGGEDGRGRHARDGEAAIHFSHWSGLESEEIHVRCRRIGEKMEEGREVLVGGWEQGSTR